MSVVFRDVELIGDGSTTDDDIDFLGTGASLTLDVERENQFLSVDLIGTGSLIKQGSMSLELTGTNTFSEGLTIEEGDLIGDSSNFGSGTIRLSPDASDETARLVFDFSGNNVFGGTILDESAGGGEVGVRKFGSGSLDISGATISGSIGFDVQEGTLVVGDSNLGTPYEYEITEDGTLEIVHASALSSASLFSGEGTIETIANSLGVLTLTGDASDFTGNLDVRLGTAAGSTVRLAPSAAPADTLSFDVNLDEAATTFEIQDDFGITFSGNVTGDGDFTKSGSGTTTLTGTHTHAGSTNVIAGTLVANTASLPSDVNLTAGAGLTFAQGFDATFAGMLNTGGAGTTVRKTGSGTLTLSAASGFAGDFEVASGGLRLGTGSGLTGSSLTIGTGSVGNAASLATDFDPSAAANAAVNRYDVGGDLDFQQDATLTVGIAATTNVNTRIVAGGNVTIDPAARLVVETAEGTYDTSLTWDILTGASITPGVDFDIQQSLFFFQIDGADVGGNTYQLSLSPSGNTLGNSANTANRRAIGTELDTFRTAPIVPAIEPEIAALQDAITSLTAAQVPGALDSVSPDDLGAGSTLALANANRSWRGVSDRLAVIRRGSIGSAAPAKRAPRRPRPSVSAGPTQTATVDAEPARSAPDWQAWLEGQVIFGELGSSRAKEIEFLSGGPIIGADRKLGDAARIGFALSGGAVSYETSDGGGEGDGASVEGTLYGAWLGEVVQVIGAARYAFTTLDTERTISIGSTTNVTNGEVEGDAFGGYLEVSGSLAPLFATTEGRAPAFDLVPIASVAYTHLEWGAFNEGGGSPLAVFVDDQELDSVSTALGFRVTGESAMEEGVLFRPRLKALWVHEWADVEREVSGTFASAGTTGTSPFTVAGAEMPRDHAELGLGWEVGLSRNANLFFDWQGRFGEDLIENSISLGGRVAW